jgi:hypothetical protein
VMLRARDALVAARTELINATRGLVKSMGRRLPKCSSPSFAQKVEEAVPAELGDALLPLVGMTAALSDGISGYDEKIEKLASEKYGHTALLRQVKGVGPITSLAYVLTLENPGRIRDESGCGTVSGISAEPGRLWRQPAAIGNRGHDAAPTARGERTVYLGAIRTGHGLTTVWTTAMRARREECEEESSGGSGTEAERWNRPPGGRVRTGIQAREACVYK